MKRTIALAGLVLMGWGSGAGCGCGATRVTMATPSASAPDAPASSAPASASSASSAPSAASPGAEPLLADARLAAAARLSEAQDFAGAGQSIERALVEAPPPAEDRPRWLYQAGRLYALGKRSEDALRVLGASASEAWVLTSYAALAAAQQAAALGRADEAIWWARAVAADSAVSKAAWLIEAEAHEKKGASAEATALLRRYLEGASKPARWAEVTVRLARALSAPGPQPPAPAALEEAVALARRVAVEQPTSPQARQAAEVERSALASLPADRRAALARKPEDELTRAAALLDGGRISDAEATLAEVEAALPVQGRSDEVACKIASMSGKLKGKRKQREASADAWGEAIKRCAGDALATALYNGGSASLALNSNAEAMARFEALEKKAPGSRLADDARLKGAQAALALGDEARFSSMLERIGEVYPEGDMATEGLFRLALHRMSKGDWAGAVAPLEASRKLRPRERDYWAAGRTEYFLARALAATGDKARADELYIGVVNDQPLSYYMALAHARLAEGNEAQAAEALRKAAEPKGQAPVPDEQAFKSPAAQRAIELLRQGEHDLARGEFTEARLLGPGASPDQQWAVAALLSSAGASVMAHSIPRGKVSDWLEHYPTGNWRQRWELAYPRPYLDVAQREARRSGIPISLAYAIMREESAFDPGAVSGAPAYGLMQFTMDTAKNVGKKLNLPISEATVKTPATSIALGCRYLADLRARYPACPPLAIPSYNAGPGATKRWLAQRPVEDFDLFVERIPYDETRNYTKRVLKSYAAYLFLYEAALVNEALRLPARTQSPVAAPETDG